MNIQKQNADTTADQEQQAPIKGIRISWMNFVTIVISCILYLLLTATVNHVSGTFKSTYNAMGDYVSCIKQGRDLLDRSDYLTEQVRLYAATADPAYMENYFSEVNSGGREAAVKNMGKYNLEEDSYDSIRAALDYSNKLKQQEIYAMSLLSKAWDYDSALIPWEVRDMEIAPEDCLLSPDEMREKAWDLVFGDVYRNQKQKIVDEMEQFQDSMDVTTKQRMEHDYDHLHKSMVIHQSLIGIHFIASLAGFVFSLLLVVLPMARYVKNIKAREKLKVMGAYECQCLAQTCNTMFARNAAQESSLRHQADHDALTGLLNRGAFDRLRQTLHDQGRPLGLLIIDVDKFKQINDSFGHDTGDRVLKHVAALLAGNFRTDDHPARIGGDEFSVILSNTGPGQQKVIWKKIEAINNILTHPTKDLPAVSLSVGGAFSEKGFTDDLYKQADVALYAVKEHGRCGCRFYDETLAEIPVN